MIRNGSRARCISTGSLDAFEAAHDTLLVLSYLDRWIEGLPERDLVDRTLSGVYPPYQMVLRLRHRDGRSSREIAALLGIEDDAARQKIVRAEAQFRQLFDAAWIAMQEDVDEYEAVG